MALMTRRAALAAFGALAAGSVLGVGYVIRSIFESPTPGFRLTNGPGDGAMMGVGPVDMGIYMDMFRPRPNRTRQTWRPNYRPTCPACTTVWGRDPRSCA